MRLSYANLLTVRALPPARATAADIRGGAQSARAIGGAATQARAAQGIAARAGEVARANRILVAQRLREQREGEELVLLMMISLYIGRVNTHN